MKDNDESMPEADDFPDFDKYINSEVLLPRDGEHMKAARVVSRAKDDQCKAKGSQNDNPMLDARIYDVMFPDGAVQQYAANAIAEDMYTQVDLEGYQHMMMDCIIDHKSDSKAVKKEDTFVTSHNGNKTRRHTTKG